VPPTLEKATARGAWSSTFSPLRAQRAIFRAAYTSPGTRADGSPLPKSIRGAWWPQVWTLQAVLGALLSWANTKSGIVKTFYDELASNTGLTADTVKRCCWALVALGFVEPLKVRGWKGVAYAVRIGQESAVAVAAPAPALPPPATFGTAEGLDVEALVERMLGARVDAMRTELRAELRRELEQHGSGGTAPSSSAVAPIMTDPPPLADEAPPSSGGRLKPTYLAGMRAALATAHRAAQERRYGGMGDDARNVRPEAWKAATALLEAVVAESGAELERAAGAVMTAYVAEPGRRDGGLVDERHPLDWFHYYAHKLKAPALAMLRRRRDEAPPDEHVVDHAAVMAELEAKRARMSGRAAA